MDGLMVTTDMLYAFVKVVQHTFMVRFLSH